MLSRFGGPLFLFYDWLLLDIPTLMLRGVSISSPCLAALGGLFLVSLPRVAGDITVLCECVPPMHLREILQFVSREWGPVE